MFPWGANERSSYATMTCIRYDVIEEIIKTCRRRFIHNIIFIRTYVVFDEQ